jgi:site-specific recombinase XerD
MTPSALPRQPRESLEETLKKHIQILAAVLQPKTVMNYGWTLRQFLAYLHAAFPRVRRLSQLRRDPHMLGWFRWLCEHNPPLSNDTRQGYLIRLRRLFHDLAGNGYPQRLSELILSDDLPQRPRYLPRPLSPQDDQLLQQELRRTDDLYSNALLLIRATGIRLGECDHLALDCLRPLDHDQWALHVPLGKLHTERLVPVDEDVRRLVERILTLRAQASARRLANSAGWLVPRCAARSGGLFTLRKPLQRTLTHAAERAECSHHVTIHQLRHTFATEMVRLGVSLPALMQLLGHKDVRMTLRYVQVTQQDLQREFHLARKNAAQRHLAPKLPLPDSSLSASSDLPGIGRALAAARHLLEMYRRQLGDEKTRRKLQRLDKRLLNVADELDQLTPPEK